MHCCMSKNKPKALVLLSGGLDSILAAKLLLEQGIEVAAVNFRTNFCGPSKARPAAMQLGIALREENIREDFLQVLKKPKFGYGSGLNPCIDCHALMLKKAGEIMRAEKFDFVATGEVLGERPMSQHRQALDLVRIGRHFFENGYQIILGRNKEENEILESLAQSGDFIVKPENFSGPVALIRDGNEEIIPKAKELILEFSKNNGNEKKIEIITKA